MSGKKLNKMILANQKVNKGYILNVIRESNETKRLKAEGKK